MPKFLGETNLSLHLVSTFLPFTFPSLSLPSPLLLLSLHLEVDSSNTARGLEKRCKLLHRGLGRSPSGNRIWCIFGTNFSELTKTINEHTCQLLAGSNALWPIHPKFWVGHPRPNTSNMPKAGPGPNSHSRVRLRTCPHL